MRILKYSAAVALATITAFTIVAAVEAQDQPRRSKASKQKAKRAKQTTQPAQTDGFPSCEAGILWVDTQCRRRDGKICTVDAGPGGYVELLNCI
jgi:hypothetical protein